MNATTKQAEIYSHFRTIQERFEPKEFWMSRSEFEAMTREEQEDEYRHLCDQNGQTPRI